MQTNIIEMSFLSVFSFITFFIFYITSKYSHKLNNGILLSSPSEEVVDLIQGNVDRLYNDFIEIVANGRGISIKEADLIAKGRVWSGKDALEVGLIDQIGSFDDAVDKAVDEDDVVLGWC